MNSKNISSGQPAGARVVEMGLILAVAMATTYFVYRTAWVSDDCFITLRYVSNTLQGDGPVFNVGDHVQGYTHPLWFVLLVLFSAIGTDPVFVAIGLGLACTFLTLVFFGLAVFRSLNRPTSSAILFALASVPWILSDPWVSFQTSGLENSLSNLLITLLILEVHRNKLRRPALLTLLACLLCLNRPDFVVLVLPLAMVTAWHIRSLRTLSRVLIAALPAVFWTLFSFSYYGDLLPNTAYAKLGIYASWRVVIRHGVNYLLDWARYDTAAALATLFLLLLAFWLERSRAVLALLVGIVFYVLWIVQTGGDFMRGRFLTPVLTAATIAGAMAVARRLHTALNKENDAEGLETVQPDEAQRPNRIGGLWLVATGLYPLLLLLVTVFMPEPKEAIENGISNERTYYPDFSLAFYLNHDGFVSPNADLALSEDLKRYVDRYGPVTIHHTNPGALGYLVGPKVTIIDLLGLTDSFIAALPRDYLIDKDPRPGHPYKFIPISYLASKGDIALIPGWVEMVKKGEEVPKKVLESAVNDTRVIIPK